MNFVEVDYAVADVTQPTILPKYAGGCTHLHFAIGQVERCIIDCNAGFFGRFASPNHEDTVEHVANAGTCKADASPIACLYPSTCAIGQQVGSVAVIME